MDWEETQENTLLQGTDEPRGPGQGFPRQRIKGKSDWGEGNQNMGPLASMILTE